MPCVNIINFRLVISWAYNNQIVKNMKRLLLLTILLCGINDFGQETNPVLVQAKTVLLN